MAPPPEWIETQAAALRAQLVQLRGQGQGGSAVPPECVVEGFASSAIEQIYQARLAFAEDARNALTTTLLSYSAGGAFLIVWLTRDVPPSRGQTVTMILMACIAFAALYAARKTWMRKLRSGYELYVAACVHAAIVSRALGLPVTHKYLENALSAGETLGACRHTLKEPTYRDLRESWQGPESPDYEDNPYNYVFEPGGAGSSPVLDTSGKVLRAWMERRNNLLRSYYGALTVWFPVASLLAVIIAGFAGTMAIRNPAAFWADRVETQIGEPEEPTVRVKLTRSGAPISDGTALRVDHGDTYTFNSDGEAWLPPVTRGRVYRILGGRGVILDAGRIPSGGTLTISLE